MRTIEEILNSGKLEFEDMAVGEWIAYTDYLFDKYEKEGFSPVLVNRRGEFTPIDPEDAHGMPFEIIRRCNEDEVDGLDELPSWKATIHPMYERLSGEEKDEADEYFARMGENPKDYKDFEVRVYPCEVVPSVIVKYYELRIATMINRENELLEKLKRETGYKAE